MARDDTREINLLDQYWDADPENRRYMSDELDENLRLAVDRFHAADDSPDPEPAFVDGLWQELAGESLRQSMATTGLTWTDVGNDEQSEPQFIADRETQGLTTRQQSLWRRRARQIGEMIAAAVVLALVSGGLILAYQNLIGEGESGPGGGDAGLVPSISTVDEITLDDPVMSMGLIDLDGQDYVVMLSPLEHDSEPDGIELRVIQPGVDGELEPIGSLEVPARWDAYLMRAGIGPVVVEEGVVFLPLLHDEEPGLWVVDLSDPSLPTELAYIETEVLPASMTVADDVLAMTGVFGGEVLLYDTSDPATPELLGSFEAPTPTRPVLTIDGSHLYMVYGGGLGIVDITDLSQPHEVGFYENPEWDGPDGVASIQPVTPERVTEQVLAPGAYSDVVVADGFAYVSAGHEKILILDVSDPAEPVEVSQFERDDRTFRLAESGDFMYVLGAEAIEDDEASVRLQLSLETIDISDPGNPRLIDRVEDFAADFESAGFAMLIGHFAHGGDSLLAYGNFPSAYLAQIEWVEAADDAIDEAPTPRADSDQSQSELPEQDPREFVIDLLNAAFEKDWDTVRDHSADLLSTLSDEALDHAAGELRGPVGSDQIGPEYWNVEAYRDWTVLRHADESTYGVVLVAHQDEWRYYPGPYWLTLGRSVDAITDAGGEPEDVSQLWEVPAYSEHHLEGDVDESQLAEHFQTRVDTVLPDDNGVIVDFMVTVLNAGQAAFDLGNVHWNVDGEPVTGTLIWTKSMLQNDESRVVMPAREDGHANHRFAFRITDLPDGAESLTIEIEDVQVSGVNLDPPDDDIDEINLSALYEFPLEPFPSGSVIEE